MAPRSKQRRLLRQRLLDALIVARRGFKLAGEDQVAGARLFGLEPGQRGAFDIEAVGQAISIGIYTHVTEHQDRVAGFHALTVAHQYGTHNTALEVLHRTAVQVDFDEAWCDHRHRERCKAHPGCQAARWRRWRSASRTALGAWRARGSYRVPAESAAIPCSRSYIPSCIPAGCRQCSSGFRPPVRPPSPCACPAASLSSLRRPSRIAERARHRAPRFCPRGR